MNQDRESGYMGQQVIIGDHAVNNFNEVEEQKFNQNELRREHLVIINDSFQRYFSDGRLMHRVGATSTIWQEECLF